MSPFLKTIFTLNYLVIDSEIHQVPFATTQPIYIFVLKFQSSSLIALLHYTCITDSKASSK